MTELTRRLSNAALVAAYFRAMDALCDAEGDDAKLDAVFGPLAEVLEAEIERRCITLS